MVIARLRTAGIIGLLAIALVGCSSTSGNNTPAPTSASKPEGGVLLKQSAIAMRAVSSAHLKLSVDGEVPGFAVKDAEGDLNNKGAAKGHAKATISGNLVETDFVVLDKTLYVRLLGNWLPLPISVADPAVFLDPDKGIAAALFVTSEAKTQEQADVDGTKTWKVTGTLAKKDVALMIPSIPGDVAVTYWIADDEKHLVKKATFTTPGVENKPATITVTLSDYNKPVEVSKP